jgi:hypothetical protein
LSRFRVLVSVVGGAAITAASSVATAAVAVAAPTAAQRVVSALDAGLGQSSVRWVTTEPANGAQLTIISDVGRSAGSQIITLTEGGGEAVLSVVLLDNTAYLIGNAGGLYLQGFTEAAAAKEANKWITVKPSSAAYTSAAAGLTVSSALDPLKMAGSVTSVPGVKVLGLSTVGFAGTSKPVDGQSGAAEKVYVRSTGKPLPVEVVQQGTTTVFDNWGEPIKVTAPRGAVPIQAGWLRPAK